MASGHQHKLEFRLPDDKSGNKGRLPSQFLDGDVRRLIVGLGVPGLTFYIGFARSDAYNDIPIS